MKNWYLFVAIFIFIGCSDEENEQELKKIGIENIYPYLYEKCSTDSIDTNKLELFNQKIYLINSITQLNENILFSYSPDILKEELSKCDFDKYSLIITSSSTINEVENIRYNFYYNNLYSRYEYIQTNYSKPIHEPVKNIYFIINAFSVIKIPDDLKLVFTRSNFY